MADFADDPRRADALQKDMLAVAEQLGVARLQRAAGEWVGPCPECGGRDRFSIAPRKGVFNCRRCGHAGDVIAMVMWLQRLTFPQALTWLCGPPQELTAAERADRAAKAERHRRERERADAQFRARAIAAAREVWSQGLPAEDTAVRDYLALRGIPRDLFPRIPVCLRFHPDLPYMVQDGAVLRAVHRGPVMLAAVQGPDGKFCAVHRTWLCLDESKGKALLSDPVTGEALPSKKVLGSKKGGAIRLCTTGGPVLVMGEGIETTLSAMVAGAAPGASYWAGVDLGNMSGQRQTGPGLKWAGIPDMDDGAAFVPPAHVERLIYVQDGDSDPKDTRAKLLAGLRRAMALRPGLRAQIVHAGQGVDLNDLLMGGAQAEGRAS